MKTNKPDEKAILAAIAADPEARDLWEAWGQLTGVLLKGFHAEHTQKQARQEERLREMDRRLRAGWAEVKAGGWAATLAVRLGYVTSTADSMEEGIKQAEADLRELRSELADLQKDAAKAQTTFARLLNKLEDDHGE